MAPSRASFGVSRLPSGARGDFGLRARWFFVGSVTMIEAPDFSAQILQIPVHPPSLSFRVRGLSRGSSRPRRLAA